MIVSTKIEGGHGLPFECLGVTNILQHIVKSVISWCGDNGILEKSSMRYFREVIKRVNKKDNDHEDQKNKSQTGLVKVSRLSNTQASHSDTRLECIMLHKISEMYRDLKHQYTFQ